MSAELQWLVTDRPWSLGSSPAGVIVPPSPKHATIPASKPLRCLHFYAPTQGAALSISLIVRS